MPMRGEIQISAAPPRHRETSRGIWREVRRETGHEAWSDKAWSDKVWDWIVATVENPEFLMVVLFCTVGLWLTFYLLNFFPDFGAVSEALQQIP
jgi:hypothetical protein